MGVGKGFQNSGIFVGLGVEEFTLAVLMYFT
jgi:hypothetical protein